MPICKCNLCSKQFFAKPSWIKRGWGKYCSTVCQHRAQKTGEIVKCFICKKETYKTQKALRGSKSKKYFCGKSCQTIWRNSIVYTGANHPNWKDGRYTYRDKMLRHKVQICKRCVTNDTRVLAVHHIDRNKMNNNLDNLVWLCHNCHFLVHRYREEI